ncbi:MAG: pectinesterase family protein [Bacteroidota bacterium]
MKKLIGRLMAVWMFAFIASAGMAQTYPEGADIVVAADGTGDFTTLQAAINAAPSNSDRSTVIYIKRGLYNTEKLIVPADKINLSLIGESRSETVISYHIYDCSTGKCPTEDAALWTGDNIATSATLTILGDGFRAENLTIQNTAGPVGQAQAITVRADKCVFLSVDFYGYQDTMYFWSDGKRSYFKDCLVVGRTDYIYGSGTVFFQDCEIRSWGGGWITAPSTGLNQAYGFVFDHCALTYATGSPRAGDDGELVRFGRPWHNYPKVAWLYCDMTGMIHPEGWGDTWDMDYAATSADLHLYEYANTGDGADMSQRAAWAGLRALTEAEAPLYTAQVVMAGSDNWDPTAVPAAVQTYNWTGGGATMGWNVPENWDPQGVPAAGESATVDCECTLQADGGTFAADLILKKGAILDVMANSSAAYISVAKAGIFAPADVSLAGKVATKDSILFGAGGILTLDAELVGVHALSKIGTGSLILNSDNSDFSGRITVEEGTLSAPVAAALGRSSVEVKSGATLGIGDNNAMYARAKLRVVTGSALQLDADVTISEFYIDDVLQGIGEYSATTNPALISGVGKVIIGRPDTFYFHRTANGNWDVAENFTPALLPEAGETVVCEEEMETTSSIFTADILLGYPGDLRLRGDHTCMGTIFMEEGTLFKYNTSGAGMKLTAPIMLLGNVTMDMQSSNTTGSTMTLAGPVTGPYTVTALNNGKGTVNSGNLLLTADNSSFTGNWDATVYSNRYPTTAGYITTIEGKSENAFGKGRITVGLDNKVIFSHSKAAGDSLVLSLQDNAKAILNVDVQVDKFFLNGVAMDSGEYSVATHPDLFEGSGKIIVGEPGGGTEPTGDLPAFPGAEGHGKYTTGGRGGRVIYVTNLLDNNQPGSLRYAVAQTGARIVIFKVSGTIQLTSALNIANDNITIAGQTAPGDGITLRDYPVYIGADNVIIRFIRFRMGDAAAQEGDALGGRFKKNIIIDHCSASWSTDECVSFYQNENFTLQWSFITESLRNSVHDKGSHGYGGIWGGKNASFHHNLMASHDSRNPRLGEVKGDAFALTDLVDLRNNVIYNWQGNSAYGGEAMHANFVNCYYKPGPATTKYERIYSIDKLLETGYPISNIWGKYYIDGNVLATSTRATDDNWTYGVYNQFAAQYTVTTEEKEAMRLAEELDPGEVYTHTAEEAYERVLKFGGASLVRDDVDLRMVHDVSTGTATYMTGGNGSVNGIIDTQTAVGGWPVLNSLPPPTDTDGDGMPDDWETEKGLNPGNAGDAQLITIDGLYPNLEVYLYSLVDSIISNQNEYQPNDTTSTEGILQDLVPVHAWYSGPTNELVISHMDDITGIEVYSLTGTKMAEGRFHSAEIRWPLPDLVQGIYLVRIVDEKKRLSTCKIAVLR